MRIAFDIDLRSYSEDLRFVFELLNTVVKDSNINAAAIDCVSRLLTTCLFKSQRNAYANIKGTLVNFLGLGRDVGIFRQLAYLIVGNKRALYNNPVLPCSLIGAHRDVNAVVEFQKYDPSKSLMQVLVLSGPHAGDLLHVKMTRDRALYIASRLGLITKRKREGFFGINSLIDRLAIAEIIRSKDYCRIVSFDGHSALRKYNMSAKGDGDAAVSSCR